MFMRMCKQEQSIVGLILVHRLKRWPIINTTLNERLVSEGIYLTFYAMCLLPSFIVLADKIMAHHSICIN